jgi:uncharacterized protein (DUF3820 family)
MSNNLFRDQEFLLKLAKARMPFGKYEGVLLVHLPEPYVVWFAREGFPDGELGQMLSIVHEIKINGLEYLFKPLIGSGASSQAISSP